MASKWLWRSGLAALATAVAVLTGPVALAQAAAPHDQATTAVHHTAAAQQDTADEQLGEPHGITAKDLEAVAQSQKLLGPPPGGWDVPTDRSYYLDASCQQYAGAIAQGASAWKNLDQSGDTPVSCVDNYITDCGGGGNIVGCNWGQGQRISLYMGGVNDDALLAAHEFGHDWYGHSGFSCAGWGSPDEVMSPTICNFAPGAKKSVPLG